MKTIGILCASDTELAPFLERIRVFRKTEKAMLTFHSGTLAQVPVVAVYSGVGKVNAAVAAQLLIDAFRVDVVINAGVAGGISPELRLFDTVAAERSAYHDMAEEILTEFHPWLPTASFPADPPLLAALRQFSARAGRPMRFGTIVSGEQFISGGERERIRQAFHPLAVDMETAAAAHVCHVNQVPFASVRTITDTADHDGADDFEANCSAASRIAAELVCSFLPEWA